MPLCEIRNERTRRTPILTVAENSDPKGAERYTLCSDFVWTRWRTRGWRCAARLERRSWVGTRRNVKTFLS
jgi:hypothetical protein